MDRSPQPEMSSPKRLLVVSPQKLFRECLGSMLSEDGSFKVREEELSRQAVLARTQSWRPAVVLIDFSRVTRGDEAGSGEENGSVFDLIRKIASPPTAVKVLVLGVDETDPDLLKCIEMGADGYVSKESSVEELGQAIEWVLAGGAVCPPRLAYSTFSLLAELAKEHQRSLRVEALQLTPREMEILQLIAENLSNKKIAERLSLSIYTVKNHVHHILDKLQVERRSEAVEYAYQRHWFRDY